VTLGVYDLEGFYGDVGMLKCRGEHCRVGGDNHGGISPD